MSKPPYAEDRTYGGVRGSGETIVSHSLLDYLDYLPTFLYLLVSVILSNSGLNLYPIDTARMSLTLSPIRKG